MHVLDLRGGEGPNFRLLGVPFDHGLTMVDAIHGLVGVAFWKMGSILRTQRSFTDGKFVNLYKSKFLSYSEYRTLAIYDACHGVFAFWDSFQERFLRELGLTAEEALFDFSLAPLRCRRDIAMLGVLQ